MDHDWWMILAQPGYRLNEQRKVLQKAIGPQAVSEYDGFIQDENSSLIEELSGFSGDPLPRLLK
jgi:hypothetical protein